MRSTRPIPRGLPPCLIDELSMLFSEYFTRFIKHDDCYLELNRVNWQRYTADVQLPLIPPAITPEHVFRSEVQKASRPLILHWEQGINVEQINQFLESLYSTELFRRIYDILVARNVCDHTLSEFQEAFRQVWFGEYSWNQVTANNYATCGFSHVFIGEKHRDEVKGLHHWVRFYVLERNGRLALHEVIRKHPSFHISSMRFSVDAAIKQYGTIFFGAPIDFEILLFFCVFLVGRSRVVTFYIDGNPVMVTSHDVATQNNALATAYFKY